MNRYRRIKNILLIIFLFVSLAYLPACETEEDPGPSCPAGKKLCDGICINNFDDCN